MYIIRSFRDSKTGEEYDSLGYFKDRKDIGVVNDLDGRVLLKFGVKNITDIFSKLEVEVYDSETNNYKKLTLRELLDLFSIACSDDKLTNDDFSKMSVKGYSCKYSLRSSRLGDVYKSNRFESLRNFSEIIIHAERFKASKEGLIITSRAKLFGYDIDGRGAYMFVPTYWLKGKSLVLPSDGTFIQDKRTRVDNILCKFKPSDISKIDRIIISKGYPMTHVSRYSLEEVIKSLYSYTERKVLVFREGDYGFDCLSRGGIVGHGHFYGNLYCTGKLDIGNDVMEQANSEVYGNRGRQYVSFLADDSKLILAYSKGSFYDPNYIVVDHNRGSDIINHFSLDNPYIKSIIEDHNNSLR